LASYRNNRDMRCASYWSNDFKVENYHSSARHEQDARDEKLQAKGKSQDTKLQ